MDDRSEIILTTPTLIRQTAQLHWDFILMHSSKQFMVRVSSRCGFEQVPLLVRVPFYQPPAQEIVLSRGSRQEARMTGNATN
eukprot:scaffold435062_cov36-Prasinocladus_malaysianus.AAC.1